MLKITIPGQEYWDEEKEEFLVTKEVTIQLEHSLVSISKWEAKWHKPFLKSDKTTEEAIDYIRCMTLTQNIEPYIYYGITDDILRKVKAYIDEPMTATWFSKDARPPSREIITSEIIYYWMIQLRIPIEFQKWHLNRLITLIRVFEAKDPNKKQKVNKAQIAKNYAAINAARRKAMHSKG